MKAEQKQTGKTDTVLWVLVLILVVFGLGALFSASEYNGRVRFGDSAYYFKKQLFATALGLGALCHGTGAACYVSGIKGGLPHSCEAGTGRIYSFTFSLYGSAAFRTGD